MRFPDFLGIGVVKAGTTWLHRQLHQHPELYLPPQKPIYYFDRHRNKPIARYAEFFKPAGDRLCGELTASYSVLPDDTIAWIGETMPKVRLLLLLREPRSRAWSEARMEFSVIKKRELEDVPVGELCAFLESDACLARGDYPAIINAWRAVFPSEQLFLGLYDDLVEAPGDLMRAIFRFLHISDGTSMVNDKLSERVFAGTTRQIPEACDEILQRTYDRGFVDQCSQLLEVDLADRWGYP